MYTYFFFYKDDIVCTMLMIQCLWHYIMCPALLHAISSLLLMFTHNLSEGTLCSHFIYLLCLHAF